jgi:hypothetical protein
MSQHDYDITATDADTGMTMRGAINAAFQALVGNNWGTTAPASPYAHMFWVDTSGAIPILKIRNAVNNAWIYLFSLGSAQMLLENDIVINGITIGKGPGGINTNTVFGLGAFASNATGFLNIAFGQGAMAGNTIGNGNTALGCESMSANTQGNWNIAIGYSSMATSTTSSNNVSIGYYAFTSHTTGDNNIAIGNDSGNGYGPSNLDAPSCTNSIFIGVSARAGANGGDNEIVIGKDAYGSGSNSVTLGNASITKTVLSGVIKKRALDPAPASATAAGTLGEIRVTATHIYVCTATNTWVRTALTTW